MDTVDLEVKIKFLEKSQEKLMDLYLDALMRITSIEKYIQSININYPPEPPMEYSPEKESPEPEPTKNVIFKRKYLEDPPPVTEGTEPDLWEMNVNNG